MLLSYKEPQLRSQNYFCLHFLHPQSLWILLHYGHSLQAGGHAMKVFYWMEFKELQKFYFNLGIRLREFQEITFLQTREQSGTHWQVSLKQT